LATYSSYLGLKLNAPTDPFQLSDFVANWGILDASPGVFICTSASRPAWVATQAGRMIFMTDLKQLSWFDGAAWNDLRDSAPVFMAGSNIEVSISAGASPTYPVCSFVTPRPCALAIWVTGTYTVNPNQQQELIQNITLDGVNVSQGGYNDRTLMAGTTSQNDYRTVPSITVVASVTSGSHIIGINPQVQANTSAPIFIKGARAMGMIALYSNSNSL
jgi:hypothetical protein